MENVLYFIQLVRSASQSLLIAVACLAGVGAWGTPAMAEKRVALAIGNDFYPNLPADRQLQKAANDAATVAEALKSLGFEVIVGTNLGRQAMIDKLADFTARLEPGDTAALFFAGHGVAIAGVNYLIPSDVPAVTEGAEARVRGASLAEPDLIAELQAKSVRVAEVEAYFASMPPWAPRFDSFAPASYLFERTSTLRSTLPELGAALDRFEKLFRDLHSLAIQ